MNGLSAANGLRRGFREAQVSDLSLLYQTRHGSDGLLDWRFGVHPVLIVKVDEVGPQSCQTRITGLQNILRSAVDPQLCAVGGPYVPKLRGQHHVFAPV